MRSTEAQKQLIGMDLSELEDYVVSLGLEKFRAKQLHKWIYTKSTRDFEEMTDLSKKTREVLKDKAPVGTLKIKEKQVSSDGTVKFLFELQDGQVVESVMMRFDDRGNDDLPSYTACVSSQVGCAVACSFCATGTLGFKRNLSASEIIEQVLFIQNETNNRVDNIVYMGQGEPLNNYDELVSSVQKMRELVGIGARHITVSTSGVVPKMDQLAAEGIQLTLALSLHDPEDSDRDYLVPINQKWPVKEVLRSLKNYVDKTKRRVTIEYVLLRGTNDSPKKAKLLGELVKDIHCNINLIPYNTTDVKDPYQKPDRDVIFEFKKILEESSRGKTVTIRQEKGHDISAACGQLANKHN